MSREREETWKAGVRNPFPERGNPTGMKKKVNEDKYPSRIHIIVPDTLY